MDLPFLLNPTGGLIDWIGGAPVDYDFLDLVLWFPRLSWSEFSSTLVVLLVWKLVSDQFDRFVAHRARRLAATGLLLAVASLTGRTEASNAGWRTRLVGRILRLAQWLRRAE